MAIIKVNYPSQNF